MKKELINKEFYVEIIDLVKKAKDSVKTAINLAMVYTYYEIGKKIFLEEQNGKNRAKYGETILKNLADKLTIEFGNGFSKDNLKLMRRFYIVYKDDKIGESLITQFKNYPLTSDGRQLFLSWTLYLKLMRINNIEERHFYEIESYKNNWSYRELSRQYDSSLYERLALNRNKEEIKSLSEKGQIIEKPIDVIKDPYVLEFLELKDDPTYSEYDLETNLINELQKFLLELGKGFTFVERQKRISFDNQHFKIDLVFYNRLLRCFVLFDLKIGELKHQDIGQMQMYVNYFDRKIKLREENKTIGILLCKDKNDSLVEMTLPEDNDQIYASKYITALPSKEELKKLLDNE